MIGIIGAMHIEIEQVRGQMRDKESRVISGIEYVSGTLHGKDVVTAACGIGKVAAAICAQTMILTYSPSLVLNTGAAGSLSDSLKIGDIAIAKAVVQHDMDTTALGDAPGFISGLEIIEISCDKKAVENFVESVEELENTDFEVGVIASGDKFVSNDDEKNRIKNTFGAIACEMEGGSIGQVCYSNGVPFAVIRAVSDCADGSSHMDYTEFLPLAAANAAKILSFMVKIA